MDFQHRPGAHYGGGNMMNASDLAISRRERQRRLAVETADTKSDPFFFQNNLGTFECRLCMTLHNSVSSYLAHTKNKTHQSNLQRHLAKSGQTELKTNLQETEKVVIHPSQRIGTPAYRVVRDIEADTGQRVLNFELEFTELEDSETPDYKIINAFQQKMEKPDPNYLYLLVGAGKYETVCFKIPNKPLDDGPGRRAKMWDKKTKIFFITLTYLPFEE